MCGPIKMDPRMRPELGPTVQNYMVQILYGAMTLVGGVGLSTKSDVIIKRLSGKPRYCRLKVHFFIRADAFLPTL